MAPERWILNASPMIVLARAGREDLLSALAEQVVVPHAVASEIKAGPTRDRARQALAAGRFAVVEATPPSPEILAWDLGSGETAVISLALAGEGWTAVLDDAAARRCARSFSVRVRGTLGIVILAKQCELITSAAEVLFSLQTAGFHLDDTTVSEALARTVSGRWPP